MTKHLLTALLIAGSSVTAKAEPTVYYCNTTAYAQIDPGEVSNVQSYPFKLFVDLENRKVKVAGDVGFAAELTYGKTFARVDSFEELADDAFYANNLYLSMVFANGHLTLAEHGTDANGKPFLDAVIAQCDKF